MNAKKPPVPPAPPAPPKASDKPADPITSNLDPKVTVTLNMVAEKIRKRADERGDALFADIKTLVLDFLSDYSSLTYEAYGRQAKEWHEEVAMRRLVNELAKEVGEIDVDRYFKTMSEKILSLEEPTKL